MGADFECGYPSEADIDVALAALGIEVIDSNDQNWRPQYKQTLWALLNSRSWTSPLGVYMPSTTTFNVFGGKYNWKGTVKTYTPGSAANPTNNDTTYIWLKPDNTIGSAVDVTGWPTTDHLKLAEIDVNSSGVITAVRDLRGEALFAYTGENLMASNVVCFDNQVVCYDNEVLIMT